ncbi:ExbD/TolR family protein [Flavobacterium sp.]|uniref:ExbD/TolR family protein n=1 Tax=Flavobacterium sp. TaxID=239 RepID=UPI003752DA0E
MAELNTGDGGGGKGGKKVRSKKSNSKVDLTAMVDLAFLLITFFMLTTSLSKPQSMDLGMPDKSKPGEQTLVPDFRSMTILIGDNNKIKWYLGQIATPMEGPKDSSYGKAGIRQAIIAKTKSAIEGSGDPKKGLIVIIKATKKSNYKNLIDILDEMAITNVPTYAISDISPAEIALLEK